MWRKLLVVGHLATTSALVISNVPARTTANAQPWAQSDIAVLLPLSHCSGEGLWHSMSRCIGNVASGAKQVGKTVSVHAVASPECSANIPHDAPLGDGAEVSVRITQTNSSASGELLSGQLEEAKQAGVEFDLVLVIGADAGFGGVMHRAVESLCGSVPQVVSVLYRFQVEKRMQLLAPLGTMVTLGTKTADILPALARSRFGGDHTCEKIVSSERLGRLGPDATGRRFQRDSVAVAGGMFWVKHKALPQRVSELSSRLRDTLGTETQDAQDAQRTLLEVWIPTAVRKAGGTLAEIAPAPKPLAMYFPQYHSIPENDKFWGKGFTEWTLLRPYEGEHVRKPLSVEAGGLGYYDLRDREVRRKQADLARSHGIQGFVYYHYWFSSVQGRKVMYKVPELRLKDGQPDLPFMLSWANEPWSRRWDGTSNNASTRMLEQEYGGEAEWAEHFNYLLQFFKHPQYIRVDGKPAFAIYRPGHIAEKLEGMLTVWNRMARESGLPGLHIIATAGYWYGYDGGVLPGKERAPGGDQNNAHRTPQISAAFHYLATCRGICWKGDAPPGKSPASSSADADWVAQRTQYWGASPSFDNSPRMGEQFRNYTTTRLSPNEFGLAVTYSLQGMANSPQRDISDNLYFLASWNEWNEQSVLEPDNEYGLGYLEVFNDRLGKMPVRLWKGQ